MLSFSDRYKLLRILEIYPEASQRELASELGYSIGKINYCLQALSDKGLVKVENFYNSNNKIRYLYKLTPAGVVEKTRITKEFLDRKIQEHESLLKEIEGLRLEIGAGASID